MQLEILGRGSYRDTYENKSNWFVLLEVKLPSDPASTSVDRSVGWSVLSVMIKFESHN